MSGKKDRAIQINQTFTEDREIFPFDNRVKTVYGLAIKADITLEGEESVFRAVLTDQHMNEYLIYEAYRLLDRTRNISVDELCEETALLDGVQPRSLRIEISGGSAVVQTLSLSTTPAKTKNVQRIKRQLKQDRQTEKIRRLNEAIADKGLGWVAGETAVSALSYSERKKLFGRGSFPPGFEYYTGGVIRTGNPALKSASSDLMVDRWDWRDRHGQNWMSPVTDQGTCGSCWAFTTAGATEAQVNLFYNQHINPDLSEQDLISCSGAGNCSGGYPDIALDYISETGVVDEASFPYNAANTECMKEKSNASNLILIGGRLPFGSTKHPKSEDVLKKMLIDHGPMTSGVYDWSHTMVLVGYQVVKEGDVFYYRGGDGKTSWSEIKAGDPGIGKTVWIFKNSWGDDFGDNGYVYIETDIQNIGWTHALLSPVKSPVQEYAVKCTDNDGDGYYWWGLGPKPEGCDGPDEPDGDDSNPELGPVDAYGHCMKLSAQPVAGFSTLENPVTEGEAVTFRDRSSYSPTTWSWSFEGGTPVSSTDANPEVTYSTPGSYDVSLVVENSEGADTIIMKDYVVVSKYVEDIETAVSTTGMWCDYKIYPNPADRILHLQTNEPTAGNQCHIFNAGGQLVMTEIIDQGLTSIDLSGLVAGIYYVTVSNNKKRWQEKFIKQ